MRKALGECDRCGQTYNLNRLSWQVTARRKTGLRVCSKCNDKDHPQLFPAKAKADPAPLINPRPSRDTETLWGWQPCLGVQLTLGDPVYRNMGYESVSSVAGDVLSDGEGNMISIGGGLFDIISYGTP